jgi:uncharacterized protein (DUF924 family)
MYIMRTADDNEIHAFWFAAATADPQAAAARLDFWFRSTPEEDAVIARRFAPTLVSAATGALDHWATRPRSCLALVVVLDQFPRNIHRGSPDAFAHDAKALCITRRGIDAGHLNALSTIEQAFFLMPFQHVEDAHAQREGVRCYERMLDDAPPAWRPVAEGIVAYARLHLDIVERFGRFPHRNRILGRASTAQELEYLKNGAESFGQAAPEG